ncbi:hypothetical protein GGI35DRAFT_300050 [Trichoderma velutinum]
MATEPNCLAVGPNATGPNIAASKPSHRYQHFIPQFLLRNFAHKYVAPDSSDAAKGRKRNSKTGMYSGEPAVNSLRLSDEFSLEESPVRRTCGLENMYEDTGNLLKDHGHLEKKLAGLESTASFIYRKIIKIYKNGKDRIWLTRKEDDFLRKFMFLLTLRSVQYHRKYNLDSALEYDGDDRVWLQEYMEAYGFTKPIDVWLQSLETIIDLEIDLDGNWNELIKERIYFPIADLFIDHMNKMHMTICTPNNHAEEFVLTENCCNVNEGRIPAYQNENMINHLDLAPCFHKFAPISPKLMIVLRYNLLPEPLEGASLVATARRQAQTQKYVETQFSNGTKSMLGDLPIRRAKNTSMEEVNGGLVPRTERSQKSCECDNFCFTIFKISAQHVRTINGLLINLAFHGLRIIFLKKKAFLELITWFLAEPCIVGTKLTEKHGAQQLAYIRGLFQFMRRERREIAFKWTSVPNKDGDPDQVHIYNVAATKFLEDLNRGNDGTGLDLETIYKRLGGTTETLDEDMAVATIMFETWTMSVDLNHGSPEYESTCRKKLERLLAGHQGRTSTRFWIFLKKMRLAQAVSTRALQSVHGVALFVKPECQGSEDMLAYAHSTVPDKELNVAMYKAFNESIVLVRGAACGLESMGQFSLFGNDKWRTSKPSGREEPREVDKKKKEKNGKKTGRPVLPDNTNEKTSTESVCKNKQLDSKEKSDDDKKESCSSQPENMNRKASQQSVYKKKKLDAEKSDDKKKAICSSQPEDGKKELPADIDEPTKTCDDNKTKDEVYANNTVCTEDKPTSSLPDESTKREEQTDPTEQQPQPLHDIQTTEDGPVLQQESHLWEFVIWGRKTPTKATACNAKARHTLPHNKKMRYVRVATTFCMLSSFGLFALGALAYLLSPVLRALSYAVSQFLRLFVWLLDNMAVASNALRFALFPLAKYLLYVAIVLSFIVLTITKIKKSFYTM